MGADAGRCRCRRIGLSDRFVVRSLRWRRVVSLHRPVVQMSTSAPSSPATSPTLPAPVKRAASPVSNAPLDSSSALPRATKRPWFKMSSTDRRTIAPFVLAIGGRGVVDVRRCHVAQCPGGGLRCRHPKVEAGVESPSRRPVIGRSCFSGAGRAPGPGRQRRCGSWHRACRGCG